MPGTRSRAPERVRAPDGRYRYGPCGSSACFTHRVGRRPGRRPRTKRSKRSSRPLLSRGRIAGRRVRAPRHSRGGQIAVASSALTVR